MFQRTLFLLLVLSSVCGLQGQNLRLDQFPQDLQFFPRDRSTNSAEIEIAGTVLIPGFNAVEVDLLRDSILLSTYSIPLSYTADSAEFHLSLTIPAELSSYSCQLSLVASDGSRLLKRQASDLVAGDAFLVHGQSNAFAQGYSGTAASYESPFIRTYGRHGGQFGKNDTIWHEAWGDGSFGFQPGAIGQWAQVMANRIMVRQQVPVCVINHAVGGKQINYFSKSDTTNFGFNYSSLLARLKLAGLRRGLTAIIWYQGESDAWSSGNAFDYEGRFLQLYSDLLNDYDNPNMKRFLVCQTRPGCGGATSNHNIIAELMRRAADELPGVSVISTNGLDGHDGCHYTFEDGYEILGYRVAVELLQSVYGIRRSSSLQAPNVSDAYYLNSAQTFVAINLRDSTETLTIESGAHQDFVLKDGPDVVNVQQSGGQLILELLLPSSATQLRYFNHLGSGPDIMGSRGIGLLSFSLDVAPYSAAREGRGNLSLSNNPVSDNSLGLLADQTGIISLTDLMGRTLLTAKYTQAGQMQFIDLPADLPNGQYLVSIPGSPARILQLHR